LYGKSCGTQTVKVVLKSTWCSFCLKVQQRRAHDVSQVRRRPIFYIGPPPISWRIFWDILRFCSTIRIQNNRFGYRILRDFAENERIRRSYIRIFREFAPNEWIRWPDIWIFRDFATGTNTWNWYSICAPDPYIRILVDTDFISGNLSDIWSKNIGYFQP
jgi:hypothetical protein